MSRAPTLRHRIEYALYRGISGGLGLAPEPAADRLGAALGWVTARTVRPRWDVAMSQLALAFPDKDPGWWQSIARRSYAHLGAEAIAMVRMASIGPEEIASRTRLIGFEVVEESLGRGQGVVCVTGHFGNWEVGGAAVAARGHPVDVVVARQRNQLFDARIDRSRARLGMNVIPRGEARGRVLEALRQGRFVGILGDQDARAAGVFVDFFGRPASTARGPSVLSLRAGARLVVAVAIREPGASPRYTVHFEPVDVPRTGRLSDDVFAMTQAYTRRLEDFVRERPEQYFWLHRRWKTAKT
ncbi:MAG: lysophospholipid acyltransferase family protein [Longimicrobiales bacterium]